MDNTPLTERPPERVRNRCGHGIAIIRGRAR